MRKQRRLEDAYRFIGFRPDPKVRGIFGDPKARIVQLLRRGKVYIYGYSFSTSASSIVSSITLPNNGNIKILAIDEVNQSEQYMVVLKGGGNGPVGAIQGSPRVGGPVQAFASAPPINGPLGSRNNLLAPAIEGLDSSTALPGLKHGLNGALDDSIDPSVDVPESESSRSSSPDAIALGPIALPLAPAFDSARPKERARVWLF
jgi:hypothetical protein